MDGRNDSAIDPDQEYVCIYTAYIYIYIYGRKRLILSVTYFSTNIPFNSMSNGYKKIVMFVALSVIILFFLQVLLI